ncbi:hypothetical protein Q9233_017739, partial [Columba guinea]
MSAKIAVETLVDEWLDTYKRDRESGFLELLNFIVRSCGCRGVVTPEMFRTLQNSQIIQRLTEDFAEPLARERRAQADERTRLTHALAPVLPQLLAKHLELVLAQLREVTEKHTAPAVLEAASRALHALCAPELALRARGDLLRSRMADQLADKCHRDVTDLLQDGRAALAPLLLPPNAELQSQLAAFLMDHVFQHEPSPTEDGESRIEELHQRRVLLAGFCKLIIYNVLELSAASDVFKHYGKFYGDYGDIIKETLNLTRQMDRQEWARTLLLSLKQLMSELLLQTGPEIHEDESFLEIRDLARRFSLLFSLHQLRNRPALLGLHREGIQFALQEPGGPGRPPLNLPFLEVLSEFSPRLLRPDRALLLSLMVEEEEEEEEAPMDEGSTEGTPERNRPHLPPQNRLRDLFDSTILGIE